MEIWEKVRWHATLSAKSVPRLLNIPSLISFEECIDIISSTKLHAIDLHRAIKDVESAVLAVHR